MPNMNITYKMPDVSTNYIATYVYTRGNGEINEEEEKKKC